jgi:TolB protein
LQRDRAVFGLTTLRRSAALALGTCMLVATVLAAGVAAAAAVPACDVWDPAWSPDGSWIAFGATSTGTGGVIETVDPAGAVLRVLTSPPSNPSPAFDHDWAPAWSPDGKRLAFVRDWRDGGSAYPSLNLLDTSTGATESVSRYVAANPTWSRTGLLGYQLYDTGDAAGFVAGSRTFISPPDVEWWGPSWSRDGSRFAFEADNSTANTVTVYIVDRQRHRRRLVAGSDPKWSPDGRWIAYVVPSGQRVDVISPDGKRHRRLLGVDSSTSAETSVVWSPDSARFVFGTTVVTLATGKTRDVPVDASSGTSGDPGWSPDGRWLVYGGNVLELIHPNGTGLQTINPCGLTPSTG